MELTEIAQVCHEANRAYCNAIGDHSQLPWSESPDWQQDSEIDGVAFIRDNPDAPPSASHDSWLARRTAEGWKYGPVKDVAKKENPSLVPYEQLPVELKAKIHIFGAIARTALAIGRGE